MIRPLLLFAPAAILAASCASALAQSEPSALPVRPVTSEPAPEQIQVPAQQPAPTPAPTQVAAPVDDSKSRIAKLESDLAAARAELKTAKSQANAAAGRAKDEHARADVERDKLNAQIAELTAARDRTQTSLEQARINLASARERLAIYEKTIREGTPVDAEQLRAALEESQQKVDMTVRAFEVKEAENNRLRAQAGGVDVKQLADELASTKRDLADAQRDLIAERIRNNNLARELVRAKPGTALVIDDSLPSTPTPPSAVAGDAKIHTVADGETLSAIAKQYYGSASRWIDIFNANRDVLQDANHVSPGTKLRIP